ncbi:MAG TPA: acyl-CoA dehydrogenase family protein [Candidatus Deferrimicrobium sp.]|nr:acyl-CoA dehydrogenase family protein [Candidatus Deferrimicrobium sp.]
MRRRVEDCIFYTDEESKFRDEVREFVINKITPKVEIIERNNDYSYIRKFIRMLGELGFLGPLHPKSYGGTERGVLADTIVGEEISAVCFALDLSRLASITLCGMPIQKFGTEEQKHNYLVPLITGEKIGAIGITEPEVGSDTAGMKTHAEREGDYFIINGEKRFITNGSEADIICLFAITTPLPKIHPKRGMSAFLVEKGLKGFYALKDYELMGLRGTRVSHLKFENVAVPAENLLGGQEYLNRGFDILMDELNSERACIASQGVGVGRGALEVAVDYSTERKQFDREIRFFEGINFKIADMATKVEASRALTIQSARTLDLRGNEYATKIASMAKYFSCETAVDVAIQAQQILGGIGYTKEYPVERYVRDSRLLPIGGGTTEIMQYLIQREVYREFGHL